MRQGKAVSVSMVSLNEKIIKEFAPAHIPRPMLWMVDLLPLSFWPTSLQ